MREEKPAYPFWDEERQAYLFGSDDPGPIPGSALAKCPYVRGAVCRANSFIFPWGPMNLDEQRKEQLATTASLPGQEKAPTAVAKRPSNSSDKRRHPQDRDQKLAI